MILLHRRWYVVSNERKFPSQRAKATKALARHLQKLHSLRVDTTNCKKREEEKGIKGLVRVGVGWGGAAISYDIGHV